MTTATLEFEDGMRTVEITDMHIEQIMEPETDCDGTTWNWRKWGTFTCPSCGHTRTIPCYGTQYGDGISCEACPEMIYVHPIMVTATIKPAWKQSWELINRSVADTVERYGRVYVCMSAINGRHVIACSYDTESGQSGHDVCSQSEYARYINESDCPERMNPDHWHLLNWRP